MQFLTRPNLSDRQFHRGGKPEILTVRLGTLDDTSWLKPAGSIWMSSAQPWVAIPEGTLLYDEDGDWSAING